MSYTLLSFSKLIETSLNFNRKIQNCDIHQVKINDRTIGSSFIFRRISAPQIYSKRIGSVTGCKSDIYQLLQLIITNESSRHSCKLKDLIHKFLKINNLNL